MKKWIPLVFIINLIWAHSALGLLGHALWSLGPSSILPYMPLGLFYIPLLPMPGILDFDLTHYALAAVSMFNAIYATYLIRAIYYRFNPAKREQAQQRRTDNPPTRRTKTIAIIVWSAYILIIALPILIANLPTAQNQHHWLVEAIQSNDHAQVRSILTSHPEFLECDIPHRYDLPLSLAVEHSDAAMVKLLLELGANPDGTLDAHHNSGPIVSALHFSKIDILILLLDAGADYETPGNPALCMAAGNFDLAVMKLLLQRGAKPNAKNVNGETPLISALRASINGTYDYGKPLSLKLHATVKLLLEHGGDPTLKDNEGKDAFDWAKHQADHADTEEIAAAYYLIRERLIIGVKK